METLGLHIARPYKNVCGIDSNLIQVHGIIKDLVAPLYAYLDISTLMDVVVIDLPLRYGLLLFKKWLAQLGGNIQNDLSYTFVSNSDGRMVRIFRELMQHTHIETKPISHEQFLLENE